MHGQDDSPTTKPKSDTRKAADSALATHEKLMSHGNSVGTVTRTPLLTKRQSSKTETIRAAKKYIKKTKQKLSQTRKKLAEAEAEANEYKKALDKDIATRRRLREERNALQHTLAHNEEELARIKKLHETYELKTTQDIAALEEALARKQLEEEALRTRLDETVFQADDTIARLREALATRPAPAPVRSPVPVTPPPAAAPAARATLPVPAPVSTKPSFAQVLADVVASNPTPQANLLRDLITQRNAPANLYPQEYSGVGAEIEGLEVVQAGIGSSFKKGDKLLTATVGKDITLPAEIARFVESGKIDFQKITDSDLRSQAMALVIRGLPGSQLTVQIEREGTIIDQKITRQLFGTDKEGKLVAFTDPKQIAPSTEMQQLLENIHEEIKGLPMSSVSRASLLPGARRLRVPTMPARHD